VVVVVGLIPFTLWTRLASEHDNRQFHKAACFHSDGLQETESRCWQVLETSLQLFCAEFTKC